MSRPSRTVVAQNRKAHHDYFIEDTVEAGLVLSGTEVKSLRMGKASINEAHCGVDGESLWLYNATIAVFPGGNRFNHEPTRPRKLLMHRRQINRMIGQVRIKGMTLIPMVLYFNDKGFAKLEIAVARGKKKYEKRETTKERDWNREKASLLKKDR